MADYISPSLIILGAILFFIAASILGGIYQETDIQVIVEIINNNRSQFLVAQVMFGLGGLLTAIGFLNFSFTKSEEINSNLGLYSSGLLIIGSILWIIHVIQRYLDPETYFLTSAVPLSELTLKVAIPLLYVILTIFGLTGYAVVFYQLEYPLAIPITLFLISLISLILIITIGGAFPPVFYYIFTFFIGIYLLFKPG